MKKRLLSALLSIVMCLSLCVSAFAAELQFVPVNTVGFSYNLDGSLVDSTYSYSISVDISEGDDCITLRNIEVVPAINDFSTPNVIVLSKVFDETFAVDIEGTNFSIVLEKHSGEYYIDIFNNEKCFSFGGERLQKMTAFFSNMDDNGAEQFQASMSGSNDGNIASPNTLTLPDDVSITTVTKNNIRVQAIWNPNPDRCVAIRINTVGTSYGYWVKRLQIKNGTVSSDRIIKSVNPTGINNAADFSSLMQYVLGFTTYNIYIPSFTTVTSVSSTYANTFAFDISLGIAWNDLIYTTGTTANAVMMYLFLTGGTSVPTVSGTVVITEHITAYGAATISLSF